MRPVRLALITLLLFPAAVPAQAPELFYEEDGAGSPVVLIPEWGHDTGAWFPLLPHLRPAHRLVRYDLRGHGRSEAPADGDHSMGAHVTDLGRVLDGLEIPRAHLVGSGLGGGVAFEFARRHPERVLSLVLVEPRLHWKAEQLEWWNRFLSAWVSVGEPSLGEYAALLVERWYGRSFPTRNPWVLPFYDLMLRRQSATTLVASIRGALAREAAWPFDARGVPALLVHGERWLPDRSLAELQAGLPGLRRVEVDAVRMPHVERPGEVGGAIATFLAEVDAGPAIVPTEPPPPGP